MDVKTKPSVLFTRPGSYQIRVAGKPSRKFLALLEATLNSVEEKPNVPVRTTFTVDVRDQAHLSGIVNSLYDHRFTLLSLVCKHLFNDSEL